MKKSKPRLAGITNSKNTFKVKNTARHKIKHIEKSLKTSKNPKTLLERLKFWRGR